MSIASDLLARADSKCELCGATEDLTAFTVSPKSGDSIDEQIVTCSSCTSQMETTDNPNHWRCLNDSMWSEVPAVQVVAYRTLKKLDSESWAPDLLNMMYLDESTQQWADDEEVAIVHKDCNGQILQAGDTVVLIKDLNVKGANFTAKRGTAVRRISLVADNPEHIEGKVSDQRIVILTQYVKKS